MPHRAAAALICWQAQLSWRQFYEFRFYADFRFDAGVACALSLLREAVRNFSVAASHWRSPRTPAAIAWS